jgi:hexosaminidase
MLSVEDHYLVDPMPQLTLSDEEAKRILGGEATMWSELVTPLTVDSRIWPRTAAIAERFWSDQSVRDVDNMFRRLEVISNSLEMKGLRHLQAKEYILRNISNYQDVGALKSLSHISEPLKIYSRNAGGTEYKSFSPFTLFADACTADARDVRGFRASVAAYMSGHDAESEKQVMQYLQRWSGIYEKLDAMHPDAPLLTPVMPYAERVRDISDLMLEALKSGELSREDMKKLEYLLQLKEDPKNNLDVELAVGSDLMDLASFLLKK